MSKAKKPKYLNKASNLAVTFSVFMFSTFFILLILILLEERTIKSDVGIISLYLTVIFFYYSVKAIKSRNIYNLNDKYSVLLKNQNNISLNRLAEMMNTSEKTVIKELKPLIRYNLMKDAFIDMDKKLLILKEDVQE